MRNNKRGVPRLGLNHPRNGGMHNDGEMDDDARSDLCTC